MPVYQTPISSETKDAGAAIPIGMLAYFRGRFSNNIHELVLAEFAAQERHGKTSRAELARKIRRKPEQITRWLGSPGNWTLDTLSDLLLGMGLEPAVSVRSLASVGLSNMTTMRPTSMAWAYTVEVQTPQEVMRDIADGNHKPLYFSLEILPHGSAGTISINAPPRPALPQPTLNVPIMKKEHVHDNK